MNEEAPRRKMANKYMSDIHLEDYAGEYETPKALCRALLADSGRE